MEIFIFGAFGLIIGSFLNVVILREGTGRSLGGHSSCASCHATLAWHDLVPVISWFTLRGKCGYCGVSISIQYPLVEGATAFLFALIGFTSLPIVLKILGVVIASLYVAIFVYDLYHTLIPNLWSYSAALLAFLYASYALYTEQGLYMVFQVDVSVWYLVLAGPGAALPLFSLWFLSRGRWMGLGDAKLALSIGWLLGPWLGLFAILGAFVLGSIVSVCILLPLESIKRALRWIFQFLTSSVQLPEYGITVFHSKGVGFTMQSEVPFGPFLIASCLLLWFLQLYGVQSPLFFLGF